MSTAIFRNRVMLAGLTISKYEGRKLDKKVTDEVNTAKNAQRNASRVNKDLFTKEAIAAYKNAAQEAYMMHYKLTLPWGDDGYRVLPTDMYFDYITAMTTIKTKFEEAVKAFLIDYNEHVQEASKMLGSMWNEHEYPKRDEVATKFRFELKMMPMPDANDFRVDISEAEQSAIQADITRRVNESIIDALKEPVRRLYDLMKHMAEKLSDPNAQFQYTMVENIRELLTLFPKFNFTNDPTLTAIANEASVLVTHSADTLRNNESVRSATAVQARALVNKVEGWL